MQREIDDTLPMLGTMTIAEPYAAAQTESNQRKHAVLLTLSVAAGVTMLPPCWHDTATWVM